MATNRALGALVGVSLARIGHENCRVMYARALGRHTGGHVLNVPSVSRGCM